jgi:hypothetical protein
MTLHLPHRRSLFHVPKHWLLGFQNCGPVSPAAWPAARRSTESFGRHPICVNSPAPAPFPLPFVTELLPALTICTELKRSSVDPRDSSGRPLDPLPWSACSPVTAPAAAERLAGTCPSDQRRSVAEVRGSSTTQVGARYSHQRNSRVEAAPIMDRTTTRTKVVPPHAAIGAPAPAECPGARVVVGGRSLSSW